MAKALVTQSVSGTVTTPSAGNYLFFIGIGNAASGATVLGAPSGVATSWLLLVPTVARANAQVALWLGIGPFSGTVVTSGTNVSKSNISEFSGFTAQPTLFGLAATNTGADSTAKGGSVTPGQTDQLVLAACELGGAGGNAATATLDGMTALTNFNIGTSNLGRANYLVTANTTARNPSWLYNAGSGTWAAFTLVLADSPVSKSIELTVAVKRASSY